MVIKEFKTSALVRKSAQHYLTDFFRERKKKNMKGFKDVVQNQAIIQVCEEGKIKVKSKALIEKIQSQTPEKRYLTF